ncbi:MAG: methylated-DNA--[protein]-cysteine S-methyltransferase [Deltaproteobacteria bacterium]|nr:methylated-DNA--[protein]-cysteine S-methyltransferase [Deltaproteobacteria bacterium]
MTRTFEMPLPSPVGSLRLVATADALVAVFLPTQPPGGPDAGRPAARIDVLEAAARELDEYFRGERRRFAIPLAPAGTEFERRVWRALAEIPFGELRSYGEVARAIGRPRAARAVGAANARNPLSIIVPCHRVVGANGALTGYAGGLAIKQWLLEHEARVSGRRWLVQAPSGSTGWHPTPPSC